MKLASHYSHYNGLEWLVYHHADYWDEIQDVIASVDAEACKTKVSEEQRMHGNLLYSPDAMNKAFRAEFGRRQWDKAGRNYYYPTFPK